MRLAEPHPEPPDLERLSAEVLGRRLLRDTPRPLAVAFSGGGDSLALLLAAHAWASRAGRPLLALTIDHGLQGASRAWTRACAARAAELGASFRSLTWEGPKPASGVPAAARLARHRLLAQAAREAGARVILLGHTADDGLEARAMRAAGSTTPEPREWSPSPVWPEGRDLFLLRPLLGVRRAEIRAWLAGRGEHWIDDPANDDPRYARARARRDLSAAPLAPAGARADAATLARAALTDAAGAISLERHRLRAAGPRDAAAFVGAACLCAAGTSRPPDSAALRGLVARLTGSEPFTATLAGARVEAETDTARFLREPGEAARGGLAPLRLAAGETAVWDGRFEIRAPRDLEVRPLAGVASRLPPHQRRALAALPARTRPGLPAVVEASGQAICPVFEDWARPLAGPRLLAACGAVEREPD